MDTPGTIKAEFGSDLELWVMAFNWCERNIAHLTAERERHRKLIEDLMGDHDRVVIFDGREYRKPKEE